MTDQDWIGLFRNPQPGLDLAELSLLESELGFRLPQILRELYGHVAAGMFARGMFVADDGYEYNLSRILRGRPKIGEETEMVEVNRMFLHEKRLIDEGHVVFAQDAGGNFYTVDRRSEAVWYWPMDVEPEPRLVGSNLVAILNGLQDQL